MDGELKHNQRVQMKYGGDLSSIKLEMEGTDNIYLSQFDEILLNPMIVDIRDLEIKKEGITLDFTAPIIFDENDKNLSGSLMKGIDVKGLDREKFHKKIEQLARSLGDNWERSVQKRKEKILKRNNVGRN
jgi:hypothetical protein